MNEQEVMQTIGEDNWKSFLEFMRGQTVGLNDDGTFDYYDGDVNNFKRRIGIKE